MAPQGSILTISANPTKISLNGTSTITVIGRKPDGNPLNPGTEIRFSSSMGSIDSLATTDRTGTATAIFRSNGQLGTATITASTGSATGGSGGMTSDSAGTSSGVSSASVTILVGTVAGSILLQPTPTSLPATGGKVNLLAIVRDANGAPLANQGVNFTSDYGTLASRGGTVTTNAQGEARDTLTLTEADLSTNVSSVMVTVQTVGGGGTGGGTSLLSANATIHIQGGRPTASFSYQQGSSANAVQFIDTSTGTGSFTYSWNFGDGASSTESSPEHLYASPGAYTVVLTVTDTSGQSDTATARITVPVTTPGNGT